MMKPKIAIVARACALLSAGSCAGRPAGAGNDVLGVWADADCELLRTERFAFEKY